MKLIINSFKKKDSLRNHKTMKRLLRSIRKEINILKSLKTCPFTIFLLEMEHSNLKDKIHYSKNVVDRDSRELYRYSKELYRNVL